MSHHEIHIDNLLSPVVSLITTGILATKLDSFVPLESLLECYDTINSHTEFLIVPRIDLKDETINNYLPKLEFDQHLVVRGQVTNIFCKYSSSAKVPVPSQNANSRAC